ncbi:MAG: pyridoxamine 5'-phosphate oxidase family protein [Acidobacteria bacterium]|nr:pyridoxamine 5'-phosphate oxidase family protein [Acidobacteriota bacterium]MBI3425621.1 pyridoxamine 5'-phosphate oxidase family protein [Acidobacteriota bacterium]
MIGTLAEPVARQLLANQNTGRLGCCLHNEPYVVPVHYLFEGESIYLHSLPGRKIEMLRANPRACLQIDAIEDDYHWRSVIAYGNYEEITAADEREFWLAKLYQELPHLSPVESMMGKDAPPCIVFRIRLTAVTGVFEKWV